MKLNPGSILLSFLLFSCTLKDKEHRPAPADNPLIGTWELVSGTTIQGKDTTVTDYSKGKKFLKIINSTHFSFVGHDLNMGRDSLAFYTSGSGSYSLIDRVYIEHLQFCNDRAWEGHDFTFHVELKDDSLIQSGIEKIDSIGVNRMNIERYIRMK